MSNMMQQELLERLRHQDDNQWRQGEEIKELAECVCRIVSVTQQPVPQTSPFSVTPHAHTANEPREPKLQPPYVMVGNQADAGDF